MRQLYATLWCGAASIAVLSGQAANAQSTDPKAAPPTGTTASTPQTSVATPAIGAANSDTEATAEIIVTGSSIRGAAPVGSNLISVGQAQIQATPAQSVQQILKSVPAVTGLGAAGQGAFQSNDASGTNAPTIHALGGSASTTTLILIDGHRIPLTGTTHALGDPNMIPTNAIERVEVLADGASSVYGSDAVAGVINFITRRSYKGIEASGQLGLADGYKTYNGSLLAGTTWDTGSAFFAYTYSRRSNLISGDRAFTARDHRAQGGTNMASFNCGPASIQPGQNTVVGGVTTIPSTNIYPYPYSTATGVANASANAFCDYSGLGDLLPREIRNNGMIKLRQEIGDRLSAEVDAVYSNRRNRTLNSRGTVTATVFGPGSGRGGQINPFYVGVPGSTATSETVRFDADELLGPGAYTDAGAEDFFVHTDLEYKISDDWRVTFTGVAGIDNAFNKSVGSLCASCATLALNGTTNAAGSLTTASVPSTGQIVTTLPLTTANALDVWTPGAGNRTSSSILAQLTDSTSSIDARQTIKQGKLQVSGSLFSLPAGKVRAAAGIEGIVYNQRSVHVASLNIGPSTTGSSRREFDYGDRTVKSAFAEVLIPVIGPDMAIPAVRSFDINVSGRIDHYSDVGTTRNPKIAANWEIFQGLKLRGNFAKSFVAPQPTNRGINAFGLTGESGFSSTTSANIVLPIAQFPLAAQLPGCNAPGQTVCTIGTAAIPGITLSGGGGSSLTPQKGKTWSIGGDFTPRFARGLRIGVTYWNNVVKGGITAPIPSLAVGAPELNSLFTLYPGGASAAQIAAATGGFPQNGTLITPVYYVYDNRSKNVLNLFVSGIDFDTSYAFSTGIGRFTVGNALTYLTKFDQQVGSTPKFSVLNTSGFNSTFPSIRVQGRANIGWEYVGISLDAFLNYVGSFRNYSANTVTPLTRDTFGNPTGGGDHVRSTKTLDLHLAYTIPGLFRKAQVFVDATNVFDRDPSFFNNANGYDQFTGNPIGRVVTVGVRTSF